MLSCDAAFSRIDLSSAFIPVKGAGRGPAAEADVCAASLATARLYIENNPGCGLMVVEGFKFTQTAETDGTRIGIPLGEDELAARINEIIKDVLASGEYETWYAEATDYARGLGL